MIKLGPAGVPLSCKGRTIRDGIEDIHGLGLQSMEIQLVRGKAVKELEDFEEAKNRPEVLNLLTIFASLSDMSKNKVLKRKFSSSSPPSPLGESRVYPEKSPPRCKGSTPIRTRSVPVS